MPLYIAKSGDLDRCYRYLTDSLTLKDRATQLLKKYKNGALVTQYTQTEKVDMLKVQIEVTRQTLRDETSLWNYPDQFFILNSTCLQNSIWKEIL